MTVQYRQVTGEFTTVLPQGQDVLVAKLDAGNPDPDGAKDFSFTTRFFIWKLADRCVSVSMHLTTRRVLRTSR